METNKYVRLGSRLKAFPEPDTASASKGFVELGQYEVKEVRANYLGSKADYVNIVAPEFGHEDTWICSRWDTSIYARLLPGFENDSAAINEQELTDLLPAFYNYSYHITEAKYPFTLQGINAPQAPPNTNNCCTFVEALVVKAWQNAKGIPWNTRNNKMMMILPIPPEEEVTDFLSPVTCLVNEGIAELVPVADTPPLPWTVIQGWRPQMNGGHTFIIVDYHPLTDRVLTLEANKAFGMNGVGCRMMGNIRDVQQPAKDWWTNGNLWTWEKMKSYYPTRKQGTLKIKNQRWV